jgi:ABC-type multidrug transport system permease subunit
MSTVDINVGKGTVGAVADRTYSRGQANLSDLLYTLSVNFLLYVVLIIVFYMLVRFYLDEETSSKDGGYALLPTSAEG